MEKNKIDTALLILYMLSFMLGWFGFDSSMDLQSGWAVVQYSPLGIIGVIALVFGEMSNDAHITIAGAAVMILLEVVEFFRIPENNDINILAGIETIHAGAVISLATIIIILVRSVMMLKQHNKK